MNSVEILALVPDPGLAADGDPTAALAALFERHGIPVRARHVIAPEPALTERALRESSEGGGLVVCLGHEAGAPVARQALARLLGTRLVLSASALEGVTAAYARRDQALPRRAEALALIPQGVTLLGPADGEPGLLAELERAWVVVLPGEATRAAALVEAELLPRLSRREVLPGHRRFTLKLVGLERAEVEQRLASALRGEAEQDTRVVEIDGEVWVRLDARGPTPAAWQRRWADLAPRLRSALGVAWYGEDVDTLPIVVGRLLKAGRLTLAVAESCTGGLIGHRLTDVSGSSAYFERGVVVYSNAAKQALLGVPTSVLTRFGAVSAECAEAMARGVRQQAGADLGLSVTGIAGPDGGTPTKPVGTVFIGFADARGATVDRHRFGGDREGNKALAALHALDLVRRQCLAQAGAVAGR